MIKNYIKAVAFCGALAMLGGTTQAAITYVDIIDGVSGNTMTNNNGTWQAWTAFNGQTSVANDGIWDRRAFGNSATIFQNAANALADTNATRLRTAITVPAPGPSQYYNVYALFWTDSSTTWTIGASVTDYPGPLPVYRQSTPGVTRFWASTTDSTTINSTSLSPNPFTTPVMISEGNRRLLRTPVLGRAYGPSIAVYMASDPAQTGSDTRTWLDGIGFELIANQILAPSILGNGDLVLRYSGTAGRLYAWEWTDSLEQPVTWEVLLTSVANSSGLVSLTNTPSGSQKFYRVHDVTLPPVQVINLAATAGNNQVSLSWTASAFATSYNVKRATSSGGPYDTITNVTTTSFVNTGLANGTTYYFVVSALNFDGEGVNSSQASAMPFPPQPPAAPTGLTAAAGNNLVLLSWTASTSATNYYVKRATVNGGPYTTITNVNATGFLNTGLDIGTTYYFVVSALNAYGESPDSSETNATPAELPPFVPTGLTAMASNSQVSLSWTASPGATSYNVKSATVNGGPYNTITNVTATSYVNTGLDIGTTYYFVVSGTNDFGESADSQQKSATPFDTPPLVYSVEFTGTNYPAPPLPTLGNLPFIQPLPDPFAWASDPLGSTRSTSYYDWSHHRAEIKAQIENYEIGYKPAVDPSMIFASISGSGTTRTLTVRITNIVNGVVRTLTQTSTITLPAASGTFPAIMGFNGASGSINLGGRPIATINYQINQVTTYGNQQNTDAYYQLYAAPYSPAINSTTTGQYSAWAWGCSRLLDGLYKLNGDLGGGVQIDLERIGVTGCSYAGKGALFCGAFDERIALTIAQESGGGGANSWRYNGFVEAAGTVEWLPNTDHNWFREDMFAFGSSTNAGFLPVDHHQLCALVAPRALFATGNDGQVWLGTPANVVVCKAVEKIYDTFGIGDRFGYNAMGGHGHCATTGAIDSEIGAFLDKFLLGQTAVNTLIRDYPTSNGVMVDNYNKIPFANWTAWWGTTNPVITVMGPSCGTGQAQTPCP